MCCSAPYHPQSNGEAKLFVQTFSNALKTRKEDEGDVQTKLSRFLSSYRTATQLPDQLHQNCFWNTEFKHKRICQVPWTHWRCLLHLYLLVNKPLILVQLHQKMKARSLWVTSLLNPVLKWPLPSPSNLEQAPIPRYPAINIILLIVSVTSCDFGGRDVMYWTLNYELTRLSSQ